jgi:hypothetical protein
VLSEVLQMIGQVFPGGGAVVEVVDLIHFSDPFKINIFDELVFYVANMSVTGRCGWSPC